MYVSHNIKLAQFFERNPNIALFCLSILKEIFYNLYWGRKIAQKRPYWALSQLGDS